jgi:hypothetical protein
MPKSLISSTERSMMTQRQVQRAEEPAPAPMASRSSASLAMTSGLATCQLGGLDFVEFVVATDDQGDQLALFVAMNDQGLDGLFDRQVEVFHQLRDGLGVWGVDQAQRFGRGWAHGFARDGFGLLDVGGVVGTVAEDDVVFAGLGQYVEFVGAAAADGAGVGLTGRNFRPRRVKMLL